VLVGCKIIKLKKLEKEIKPVALYNQIVISCAEKPKASYDNESKQLATQKIFESIGQHHFQWENCWKINYGK
jgi:hypothetical protein